MPQGEHLNGCRRLFGIPLGGCDAFKFKVLRRDGILCVVCGYDVVVDVDHMDGDRTNNDPANGQVLCPNHHAEKTRLGFIVTV